MLSEEVITALVSASLVSSGLLVGNFGADQQRRKKFRAAVIVAALQAQQELNSVQAPLHIGVISKESVCVVDGLAQPLKTFCFLNDLHR